MTQSAVRPQGLRHRAFFVALAASEEGSARARVATAGLLVMRLIDHWLMAGPVMVEPESISIRSSRDAIMALDEVVGQRQILLGVVNTLQTIRGDVDLSPVLPRVFSYAGALESQGELAMAADVYGSVADWGSGEEFAALAADSLMRLGFCRRTLGALPEADQAYVAAADRARRVRDLARVRRAEIGRVNVLIMKGNLPKAESQLRTLGAACERDGLVAEHAATLHLRAVVAQRAGAIDDAIQFAYESLKRQEVPSDRDRLLADLAAFFIVSERYEGARDSLLLLDATAQSQNVRLSARVNLVALAARADDLEHFLEARERVAGLAMPGEAEVNFLLESAKGFRRFGDEVRALSLLREAKEKAEVLGLNRSAFEADELLRDPVPAVATRRDEIRTIDADPTAVIAREIRKLFEQFLA